MGKTTAFPLSRVLALAALMLCASTAPAQSPRFVNITPEKVTLLIGESKTFRVIDQDGRMQRTISWNVSDPDAFQTDGDDELTVTAKRAGEFTITAQTGDFTARATVTVMLGKQLPQGTLKWSGVSFKGCTTTHATPAVPSANGPDIYEQSKCEDGEYLSAYTADGILLWRHKIGAGDAPVAKNSNAGNNAGNAAADSSSEGRLNLTSKSVCDAVAVNNAQQKVRDLLSERSLAFSVDGSGGRVWTVNESGLQCRLWFDEKLILTKKQKIFVNE